MSDFRDWDDLIEDAAKMGQLACYKLDVLLKIYGIHRVGSQANLDIVESLNRRGYGIQPEKFVGFGPDSWIRIYYKNSPVGIILEAARDISPQGNIHLRTLAKRRKKDDALTQLIALAKTIHEDV